jgi:hypothetical protein
VHLWLVRLSGPALLNDHPLRHIKQLSTQQPKEHEEDVPEERLTAQNDANRAGLPAASGSSWKGSQVCREDELMREKYHVHAHDLDDGSEDWQSLDVVRWNVHSLKRRTLKESPELTMLADPVLASRLLSPATLTHIDSLAADLYAHSRHERMISNHFTPFNREPMIPTLNAPLQRPPESRRGYAVGLDGLERSLWYA